MYESPYPISEITNDLLEPQTLTLTPFLFEEKNCYRGSLFMNNNMYAFDRNSIKHQIRITNHALQLCIKLPTECYEQEIPNGGTIHDAIYTRQPNMTIDWNETLAQTLIERFNAKLRGKFKSTILDHKFDMRRDIYFYKKGDLGPYLYVYFRSLDEKKDFKNICSRYHINLNRIYRYIKIDIHEEKISSWLNIMASKNLKYNSWFTVEAREVPFGSQFRNTNRNIREFYVDYETITPIDPRISASWFVKARYLGFDIETYGHEGTKRMTSAMELKDPIFIISVDFKIAGIEASRKKYCLVYGESNPLPGVEVINFAREQDLLVAFSHLIVYLNPDIVMGYNVYKFDWPYILGRYAIHHIPENKIPTFGCIPLEETTIYDQGWSSSGSGNVSMMFPNAAGVLMLDMYVIMKRYYKYRTYSLNAVCKENDLETKKDVTVEMMFDAFASYQRGDPDGIDKMTVIADYCVQDSKLVIDLFEKTQMWFHLLSLSGEGGVSIADIMLRGEQCRCYSQLYYQCLHQNYVLSNSQFYDYYYTGGYVGKPEAGVQRFVFTLDFTSLYPSIMQAYNLSFDTLIPIWFWPEVPIECCEVIRVEQEEPAEHYSLSRRDDIIEKLKLRSKGYPVEITDEEIQYYQKNVTVTTPGVVDPLNVEEDIIRDQTDLTEITNKVMRCYEFRFIKKVHGEGLMPKLEREWVATRKGVKGEIKQYEKKVEFCEYTLEHCLDREDKPELREKELAALQEKMAICLTKREDDDTLKEKAQLTKKIETIEELIAMSPDERLNKKDQIKNEIKELRIILISLDKKQNAIKIIANSGYGFTGVRKGMLSGVFIAICVTYLGRKLVTKANDVLVERFEHLGAKVVYNDTDSSMISLDIDETADLRRIGKEMEDVISGRDEQILEDGTIIPAIEPVFKKPLKMEFEDVSQMCPIKPKYYLKAIRETDPEKIAKKGPFVLDKSGKPKIKTKGVLTAKRGNSKITMNIYSELSDQVLFLKDITDALRSLGKFANDLLTDKFDAKDLAKVNELGASYVQESYFLNVLSKNMALQGKPVRPGDRIEYIIVKPPGSKKDEKIGNKCRELEMWLNNPNREPIDYEYYISKGLETQYDCLFNVGFKNITMHPAFREVGYKPKFSACHFKHFGAPVEMVAGMVSDLLKASDQQFDSFLREKHDACYDARFPRNLYVATLVNVEIEKICAYIKQVMQN